MNNPDALIRYRLAKIRENLQAQAQEQEVAVAASVIGDIDLPVSSRDHIWDGDAAKDRVFAWADGDPEKISRAFLHRETDGDPTTQGAYRLGFADVIDGELTIIPRGVSATAGGRGVDAASIPEDQKERIRGKICDLYRHIRETIEGWPSCPFDDEED